MTHTGFIRGSFVSLQPRCNFYHILTFDWLTNCFHEFFNSVNQCGPCVNPPYYISFKSWYNIPSGFSFFLMKFIRQMSVWFTCTNLALKRIRFPSVLFGTLWLSQLRIKMREMKKEESFPSSLAQKHDNNVLYLSKLFLNSCLT